MVRSGATRPVCGRSQAGSRPDPGAARDHPPRSAGSASHYSSTSPPVSHGNPAMIERLITTLQTLAAPADLQRHRLPPHVPHADELARDFEDSYRLVCDCPQIRLTPGQRVALGRVESQLDAIREHGGTKLWNEAALRSAPAWTETRRAAVNALAALDAPALGSDRR